MKKINKEQLYKTVEEGIKEKYLLDMYEVIFRLDGDNKFYYTFDSFHSPKDKDFTYSITNPFEDLASIDEEGELLEGDAIDTTCLANLAEEYTQDIIQELKEQEELIE